MIVYGSSISPFVRKVLAFAGEKGIEIELRPTGRFPEKDPEFLEETNKLNIEVDPVSGAAMQKIVADVLATPKPVLARGKPLME